MVGIFCTEKELFDKCIENTRLMVVSEFQTELRKSMDSVLAFLEN